MDHAGDAEAERNSRATEGVALSGSPDRFYRNVPFPLPPFSPKEKLDKLWAGPRSRSNKSLSRVVSPENPGDTLPFEMLYGFPSPLLLLPILTPVFFKVLTRGNKAEWKGKLCFYLNGGSNHLCDSYKLLLPYGRIIFSTPVT